MSSILKALNRLKKESPKQDETPSWPQEINTKRAARGGRKRNWIFNKPVYLVTAVVIFVCIGWLLYSQKPHLINKMLPWVASSKKEQDEEKVKQATTKSKSAKSESSISRRGDLPRKPSSLRKRGAPPRSLSQKRILAPKGGNKSRRPTPFKKMPERAQAPGPKKRIAATRPESRRDTKVFSPISSQKKIPSRKYALKPKSQTRTADRAAPSAGPTNDSKFKLQAIAWSNDPKKRIAVVNDLVVKEGSSIEGARVTRVGRDEVIVREGGKDYKLVFGLR